MTELDELRARLRGLGAGLRGKKALDADIRLAQSDALELYLSTRNQFVLGLLVQSLQPYVRVIAEPIWNLWRSQFALQDLMQEGSVGLVLAITRFDVEKNLNGIQGLTNYASPYIFGYIMRAIRDHLGWQVYVPRTVKERMVDVNRARRELPFDAELDDIAAHLEMTVEKVGEATIAAQITIGVSSLDCLAEAYGHPRDAGELDAGFDRLEDEELAAQEVRRLWEAIDSLEDARHQEVIRLYFIEGWLQREIAKKLGFSEMHITRMRKAALAALAACPIMLEPLVA